MKLKLYRITLLIFLFISFVITTLFLITTIVRLSNNQDVMLMDKIVYIACFALLLIFTGLEILNTILSFKNGSSYIVYLAYNDDKTINHNFLLFTKGVTIFSVIMIVYFCFIYNGYDLPLSGFDKNMSSFVICVTILIFINCLYISLFPKFASEDKGLQTLKSSQ